MAKLRPPGLPRKPSKPATEPSSAPKPRQEAYPRATEIPDHIWLPFTFSLTGDAAADARAVQSFARIFGYHIAVVAARLQADSEEALEAKVVH